MDFDKILKNQTKFEKDLLGISKAQKKEKNLTPGQRLFIWEHPKMFGRTCSICKERIYRQSDLELDHTKAKSKGGKKLALAHKHCNRIKGSGSLGKIQKALGLKTTERKKISKPKKTKRKDNNFWDITSKW